MTLSPAASVSAIGIGEADPLAVADCRNGRRQRAHLDADLALPLAKPVPIGNTHRLDGERAPRPDDDPRPLGLDAHDVERLLLPADLDPAALADGEMDDAAVTTVKQPRSSVALRNRTLPSSGSSFVSMSS